MWDVELEKIPTVPTAEEILDRSLRRAASRRKEKKNRERADREFVMAVAASLHDRLVKVIASFPDFEGLPPCTGSSPGSSSGSKGSGWPSGRSGGPP